jgi:hypothetical protein
MRISYTLTHYSLEAPRRGCGPGAMADQLGTTTTNVPCYVRIRTKCQYNRPTSANNQHICCVRQRERHRFRRHHLFVLENFREEKSARSNFTLYFPTNYNPPRYFGRIHGASCNLHTKFGTYSNMYGRTGTRYICICSYACAKLCSLSPNQTLEAPSSPRRPKMHRMQTSACVPPISSHSPTAKVMVTQRGHCWPS